MVEGVEHTKLQDVRDEDEERERRLLWDGLLALLDARCPVSIYMQDKQDKLGWLNHVLGLADTSTLKNPE
ncbi:uncharacterized protein ColSpa_06318 [Colletotrichum spaethianum]|uniref:Uncharacterized protein n=1 Tax=Colletotrichum spaethianum TaxID=700344 RepID=A0AA37LKR2_9PEZI|nr:uncharacterized protein ColSpa_06318 [Colletotrichum spaethianum]GKT46137.1 hypothetical protein ColSpa_06318 [Colletotrichum spaethianum]